MRPLALLPIVAVALAGCIGTGTQVDPAALPGAEAAASLRDRVLALAGELPCEAEVGEGTSANLADLASAPLDAQGYVGAAELWLHGDRGYVARYGTGGFSIVDLADPLQPEELGTWDPEETDRGLDVKTTTDGSAVLMGGDQGIKIVDVRDPAKPVLEYVERFERPQAHMLTVFRVGGEDYVSAAKGDAEDLPIWRVTGGPGAHQLQSVSSPALTTFTKLTGRWSPHDLQRTHDAFFYDDPLVGPTLWVANVWDGIVALDVRDPAQPEEIARIPNDKPQYTHTVQTLVLGEGSAARRVTVSMSEVGVNTLRVFDTTDLAAPRLLAEWHVGNPAKPQHNIQLVPPYLYVAHYEFGVFVFALEDLLAGRPAPIARLASNGGDREGFSSPTTMALDAVFNYGGTWDVGLRDGLLFVSDGALRVAAFGCLQSGDAAIRSVG